MSYIIELRKALDEAGFADTKIVAPDLNKAVAAAFIQQWLAEPPGSLISSDDSGGPTS